jgi:aminoglycoside 3-N-acetyltransferase
MSLKRRLKSLIVRTLFSYDGAALVRALRDLGVGRGDLLMVHATWNPNNGFRGGPAELIAALKEAVGWEGVLAMTTMTYVGETSAEFLARGKPMDVRRSASRMGLLTEVFRRGPDVRRSLSPTHPVCAWGGRAEEFLAWHETTPFSFGPDSPYGRLAAWGGKLLGFDAGFDSFTFTHHLEHRVRDTLPFPFYESAPRPGVSIDRDGNRRSVPTMVISQQANRARREPRLVARLERDGVLKRKRIGNTRLLFLDCKSAVASVEAMIADGDHFFETSAEPG